MLLLESKVVDDTSDLLVFFFLCNINHRVQPDLKLYFLICTKHSNRSDIYTADSNVLKNIKQWNQKLVQTDSCQSKFIIPYIHS